MTLLAIGSRPLRAALALLPLLAAGSNLPYNPTRLHLVADSEGNDYVYIIQPGSDSTTSANLSYVDLSTTLTTSSVNATTLSTSLPFFTSDTATAYTSFVDSEGNITVIAGDCSDDIDGASLWRLAPDPSASDGGTWYQDTISTTSGLTGANYLSTAIAYSEVVVTNVTTTELYVFGGMCPTSDANSTNWISAATYNNDMILYSPEDLESDGEEEYTASSVASEAPPIAEAGMAMVALTASYSNSTGVETQTQDFVVLGGHTASAFINMSQIALFSLPQASWTFLTVAQPDGATSVDDANYVTPRSGHTAVLSEDGTKIIIFGGWVGDVDTPASPRMAVLSVGAGYGGSGSWEWSIVSPSGTFSGSDGLYGHGAIMLPGNVMMITGGYSISSSSSSRLARRDTVSDNTDVFLYNVTSDSWVTTYTSTASDDSTSTSSSSSSSSTTSSQKAGVGVGVTFGVVALVGAGVFYAVKNKRQKRQKTNRDSALIVLRDEKPASDDGWKEQTMTGAYQDSPERPETPKEAFPWLPNLAHSASWGAQQSPAEGGATGAFLNIPSPTRGMRRPPSRNYQYLPNAVDEHGFRMSGMSTIEPISEADEESSVDAERRLTAAQTIFDSSLKRKRVGGNDDENPFADPQPLGSHPLMSDYENDQDRAMSPVSPIRSLAPALILPDGTGERYTIATDWASAREYPDGRSSGQVSPVKSSFEGNRSSGNVSPTKSSSDDRTLSNLSDRSSRSFASIRSHRKNSITSQPPIRSSTIRSQAEDDPFYLDAAPHRRNRSSTSPVRPAIPDRSSDRPPSRAMGWVGSLRKALGTYTLERSTSAATLDPGPPQLRFPTPSPTRPKRIVSDSSTFLVSKRGQDDWGTAAGSRTSAWDPFADAYAGDWGEPVVAPAKPKPAVDEWDVEGAAATRDFQVMFSVPKARLRVVNADPERESIRSLSGDKGKPEEPQKEEHVDEEAAPPQPPIGTAI